MSAFSGKSVRFVDQAGGPSPLPDEKVGGLVETPATAPTLSLSDQTRKENTTTPPTARTETAGVPEPCINRNSSSTFSLTQSFVKKSDSFSQLQNLPPQQAACHKDLKASLSTADGENVPCAYQIDTVNHLAQDVCVKLNNPFQNKVITVYAVSPFNENYLLKDTCTAFETNLKNSENKSKKTFYLQKSGADFYSTANNAYVVLDIHRRPKKKGDDCANRLYVKAEPGCHKYSVPVRTLRATCNRRSVLRNTPATSGQRSQSLDPELSGQARACPLIKAKGSNQQPDMDIYNPVNQATLSRTQEKQELQQLNDRFAAYIQRVRMLAEKNNQLDSSAIIKSTKVLEQEIHNLKNMYEQELNKLRKELEACNHERTTHEIQAHKQLQYSSELQDRLNIESNKNSKLLDEVNNYQRKMSSLEAEIQDLRIASARPRSDVEQLQRTAENLTRENETWKHRYEHEQVARQESENKIQHLMQKADFEHKVHQEQLVELHSRIETAAATILSLEAKVRELSKADVSVAELLKQVRESAEAELRKYQVESNEQYNRNLTALKAQLDSDAKTIEQLETETTQLRGGVGELQARIRNMEGQVASLEHQKQTLEDAVAVERNRAADSARALERKLREVQDLLVVKMREVTMAREQNVPVKAEIEALKVLLEEEEKRLRVPLGVTSVAAEPTSFVNTYSIAPSAATTAAVTCATHAPKASSCSCQKAGVSYAPASYSPYMTTSAPSDFTPLPHSNVGFIGESRPYVPSPPLSVTYIPDELQSPAGAYNEMFSLHPLYADEMDPQMYGYMPTMPQANYTYETSPGLNKLTVEPSPPLTSRPVGPVRAKSAPAERKHNLGLVPANLGQGHDYFDKMFDDLQRDTLYSRVRPKSSPMANDRPLSSTYHDYTVSTSSATGDLKIFEVHQDGKYVRLLNDGVQDIEFGGYMLQQNVGGHPVAVFRFPPRTKFAPNSTITVYAGCNDHTLHNPPQDFVWKEQQKWGTGPECTTILCRPNGQAVAWTTAAHRFTRDAFKDNVEVLDDLTRDNPDEDIPDDDSLTEINVNINGPKTDPVYLRREKQQPPSLQAGKHPHGSATSTSTHPNTGQPRPLHYGNDNSSNNRQTRSQSTRPDPVPGQTYAGASAQRMGSAPLRKFVAGVSTQQQQSASRGSKSAGIIRGPPSPFYSPLQQELQLQYGRESRHSNPIVHFEA